MPGKMIQSLKGDKRIGDGGERESEDWRHLFDWFTCFSVSLSGFRRKSPGAGD